MLGRVSIWRSKVPLHEVVKAKLGLDWRLQDFEDARPMRYLQGKLQTRSRINLRARSMLQSTKLEGMGDPFDIRHRAIGFGVCPAGF